MIHCTMPAVFSVTQPDLPFLVPFLAPLQCNAVKNTIKLYRHLLQDLSLNLWLDASCPAIQLHQIGLVRMSFAFENY